MTKLTDVLSAKLATIPRISSVVGTFVAMVGPLARVNVQGATVDIRCDGWYPPIVGMPVRVEVLDSTMRVAGPTQALSPRGQVVESVDGGIRARVIVDGDEYTLPVIAPYMPVPTDDVIINWTSGHILGEEAAPTVVAPPGEIPVTRTDFADLVIQPTASGKYDLNWNNWYGGAEVRASNNNRGIWVYGGRHNALSGADVTKIEVCLPTPITAVGAAFIGLHGYGGMPGGAPTITDLIPLNPRSGWIELPGWWGNHLRDNPDAGIGVTSGAGDNRWPGVGQAGGQQSGWLRFAGTR